MSNQAVALGVAAFNESQKSKIVAEVERIVAGIRGHQTTIESIGKHIAAEQEKVQKLAQDVITPESITGTTWAGTLNQNQTTILETIGKMNKDRQDQVQLLSQSHINKIESWKKTIKAEEEAIAKLREEANKLAIESVTVAQVLGQ